MDFFSLPGTPIMFTLSTMYSWLLVGPMALLGLLIVLLLYPIMVRLTKDLTMLETLYLPCSAFVTYFFYLQFIKLDFILVKQGFSQLIRILQDI